MRSHHRTEDTSSGLKRQMTTTSELYDEADRLKDDGQYETAIEKLNELLRIDDSYVLAHSALAVLYGRVNQHDKAIEHGVRVSELEPNDSFSWTALSVTYQRAFAGTDEHMYIKMAEDAMAKAKTLTGH
ncbi:tetratricopeptide repeat protein [Gimesia panareensis]|uniref:tetratricopeptide repeat protein n=1 Tax=Gimesia panareensis TaxID=2527978 RepID=UPI00118C6A13|nr:tetratricopeptide repeat protein [Gimesia panareensis]QDU52334.1 Tetratricopeptide repeat protein [Gimesia panareensis]